MHELHEKIKQNAEYLLKAYHLVIEILVNHRDSEGISRISQKEIASILGVSQTVIAKRFKNLRKFGAIEKVGHKNAYLVRYTNLLQHSPLSLVFKLAFLFEEQPELVNDYYKQAEIIGVSYNDIQIARGYLTYLIT